MRIVHRHFPLHPSIPDEGLDLTELFRGRKLDLEGMHAKMKALMDAEGLPFVARNRTYNSRLAQELGAWGASQGRAEIHDALYRAYFVNGVNLGKIDALVPVAESVGLGGDEARRVLEERTFRDEVDRDWDDARQMGITGVPTFVCEGRGVVGAQPYEALEKLVRMAGAVPADR